MLTNKKYLQINQALFSLTHAYESRMSKESDNELSLPDCSMLMLMHQFAPMTAVRLSEITDINPGTISVYMQRLVKKGLVRREQDQEDRRIWWLTLSEEGKHRAGIVVAYAASYTSDFLSTLNADEQKTLHKLLLKASHSLGFDWQ